MTTASIFAEPEADFAISYPILGGTKNVFGTLLAVIFIQGILIEAFRFLEDWRLIIFGLIIILVMNFMPDGLVSLFNSRKSKKGYLLN